jgi:hypothetical protein
MHFISHRGNINQKQKELENQPLYINNALNKGFEVEIDVWLVDKKFFLGHDYPDYLVDFNFLLTKGLWLHTKNIDALDVLASQKVNCFFHKSDDVVLTSKGYLWTFPGKDLKKNSICVLPEISDNINLFNCAGICSDFIEKYQNEYNKSNHF